MSRKRHKVHNENEAHEARRPEQEKHEYKEVHTPPEQDAFSFNEGNQGEHSLFGMNYHPFRFKMFNNFLKSSMAEDVKSGVDKCINAASFGLGNLMDASTAAGNTAEEVSSKISESLNELMTNNMEIGHEFFKCKDAQDLIAFQKKLFESNVAGAVNCYVNIGSAIQSYFSKYVDISSGYIKAASGRECTSEK